MNIVTLDFETYFDSDYTLSKLTTEAYVRDARFEALGCGVRWPDGQLEWLTPPAIIALRRSLSESIILCHHAHFDGLILSHVYDVRPAAWLDTLSMARLLVGNHLPLGLDALARHFALAGKTLDYASFKGRRWAELDAPARAALAAGCLHDVELTWQLFQRLAPAFPIEEYPIVDQTIRLFTEPTLTADTSALADVWLTEEARKTSLQAALGLDGPSQLQSTATFVALLEAQGVVVPTKPGKNGPIPCLAKTDQFMKDLLDDENDRVRALAEARLGVRSTIDQTRAQRLAHSTQRGPLPVYLGYAGAHTTRWSGGDKLNWQNFRRGGGIRKAIRAPTSHRIVKADKSQIECRLLNAIAGQHDVIERFRNKEDIYVGIASLFYGRPITKADSAERGVGKQLELSCGYGAGADTIIRTAARGTYGPPVVLDANQGLAARDLYRRTHERVVALWREAGRVISRLAGGTAAAWNVVGVETGVITLPNGAPMLYPELEYHTEQETGEGYWRYRSRNGWVKLYGAKLVENLIQGLARVDMSQTLLRIRALDLPAKLVNLEHDAAAFVVLDNDVELVKSAIAQEFCRSPAWLPDLPLDCEVYVGEAYG